MEKKFVINVGRQLGSGGYEIGKRLAERFGIAFYDKELLSISSEESGLSAEFFERADERAAQGIFGGLLGLRFPFVGEGAIPQTNCTSNDALFKVQSDVIRRLADEKSCLFMGRCADYILRDHPRCANIFISSTRQDRIARLRRLYGIGETEADDMIEKRLTTSEPTIIIIIPIKTGGQPRATTSASTRRCWALMAQLTLWHRSYGRSWGCSGEAEQ